MLQTLPSLAEVDRALARKSLMAFVPWATPKFAEPRHLGPLVGLLERIASGERIQAVIHAPPRHGKAVADDTPILTGRGWLTAGEVVVGDVLVGSDGGWTRVTATYPQGVVPLFRVRFSDGASLVTCGNHRWAVRQRYYDRRHIKTTAELAENLNEADSRKKWRIPMVQPWPGTDQRLPLEPYLFGVWLGDGTSARSEITTADPEVIEALRSAGIASSYVYSRGKARTYGLPGRMHKALKAMGVYKNKHIPDAYLRADLASRLALLQGLGDTDGTVARNGSQQSICTTSERLADGIKTLVASLGGTWTEVVRPAAAKLAHNIYFRLPNGMAGFRLPRKQERLAASSARNAPRRFVADVESVGSGSATCFTVDAKDHLFCAGRDFVVTHNSETVTHAIPWMLWRRPDFRVGYATHGLRLSRKFTRKARGMTTRLGVQLAVAKADEWRTEQEGGLIATSVGASIMGEGLDLLIVDDPYPGRREAESANYRETVQEWFDEDVYSRLQPEGSCIVFSTRWHTKDLSGKLISDGWPYIKLAAVSDDGRALWPEVWNLEALERKRARAGEYGWTSVYQGEPRPRGGALFGDNSATWTELPKAYRAAFGVDLAYGAKTSKDYSVAVKVLLDRQGNFYVVDVLRKQCDAPRFKKLCRKRHKSEKAAPWRWYTSTTEAGVADLFNEGPFPVPLEAYLASKKGDKFTRAQPFAAAWNAGKVFLPKDAPWLDDFVSELADFTGAPGDTDDQVDAVVAAFDLLAESDDDGEVDERPRPMKHTGLGELEM